MRRLAPSRPVDKGGTIATRRSTAGKRDHELAKKTRAAAKRERRALRARDDGPVLPPTPVDPAATEDLVVQLRELHEQFDAGKISFEAFDTQREALSARIADGLTNDEARH
ncbi:MAG TPA: hypothetical protein VFR41_14315 [Acidimicrobiia bacterium]|nr:hypothetical protein [Acidimicrobiia bacterium]